MPCWSRIEITNMTDARMLMDAVTDLGMGVDVVSNNHLIANSGSGYIEFKRKAGVKPFTASGDLSGLKAIRRKYTEAGVRKFARSNGWLSIFL